MRPFQIAALIIACAAAAPACADMYRWVDERGVTHYSDRRPNDSPSAEKMDRVRPVETRRFRAIDPAAQQRPPANHFATIDPQPPVASDPCRAGGCAGASGVLYPYPVQGYVPYHRRPPLVQAQLPPGAIAGTVNSPGIIPGNSASASPVIPQTFNSGPRMRPLHSPSSLEPPVHGHTQRNGRR